MILLLQTATEEKGEREKERRGERERGGKKREIKRSMS
jgi:hypothetical protein